MRLIRAELMAMRRRAATYVVLGVLLAVMGLIYLVVGLTSSGPGNFASDVVAFPQAFSVIGQLVFGLGSLIAVIYAAAIAGGDWNWGIPRIVLSRGESRVTYVLAKAVALAIVLGIGVLIAYAAGIALVYMAAAMSGVAAGDPFGGTAMEQLLKSLGLGYPVLIERAAIALAVAILLRSQLAGIVIGIVLYIGEGILGGIMLAIALSSRFGGGSLEDLTEPFGPEWYQYLPFTVGDSVLAAAASSGADGGFEEIFLRPVPLEQALVAVAAYAVVALAVAVVSVWRAEISA